MFKFDFTDDDIEEHDSAPIPEQDAGDPPCRRYQIEELISRLPSKISYSPITVSLDDGSHLTMARRDLFDARFQYMASDDMITDSEDTSRFIDTPSDLVPGVYEGGLKTWECSLDLIRYLRSQQGDVWGNVLEIGCGTALPSAYILREILKKPPTGEKTSICVQDYNPSVLQLVTLPNLILAWHFAISKADPSLPGDLDIDPALTTSFLSSLTTHGISLEFISGPWSTFDPSPTDLILTSETIYRTASLPALISILEQGKEVLVAAKVLYFGVGGGLLEFGDAVRKRGGVCEVVQKSEGDGVGREVVRVRLGDGNVQRRTE